MDESNNQSTGPTPDDVMRMFLVGIVIVILIAAGFALFLYSKLKAA